MVNMTWGQVVPFLPDREGYNNLEIGLEKKKDYIHRYLPELFQDPEHYLILDVGAGTGFFCHV